MPVGLALVILVAWWTLGADVFRKPPIWLRVTSALVALFFFCLSPLSLFLALCFLSGSGPGGGHSPVTFWAIVIGVVYLLIPVFGVLLTWLALGTLVVRVFRHFSSGNTGKVDNEYRGPRCVACNEPVSLGIETCPKCGWTQPR
jgi:hypothetical protein